MENQDQLSVERIGGFGGFGLPNSHLKSKGDILLSALSPKDMKVVNSLFKGEVHLSHSNADGFIYRITRKLGKNIQTIEVPEQDVPMFIQHLVKDILE